MTKTKLLKLTKIKVKTENIKYIIYIDSSFQNMNKNHNCISVILK